MSTLTRQCPACGESMDAHDAAGLRLDICPGCGGVWYDIGEFPHVVQQGQGALMAVEGQEPVELSQVGVHGTHECPVCLIPLHTYSYGGRSDIQLNGCPGCNGIFVERNALYALLRQQQEAPKVALSQVAAGLSPDAAMAAAQLDAMTAANIYRKQVSDSVFLWSHRRSYFGGFGLWDLLF